MRWPGPVHVVPPSVDDRYQRFQPSTWSVLPSSESLRSSIHVANTWPAAPPTSCGNNAKHSDAAHADAVLSSTLLTDDHPDADRQVDEHLDRLMTGGLPLVVWCWPSCQARNSVPPPSTAIASWAPK